MYNFPNMRNTNAAFWTALSMLLRDMGISGLPDALDVDARPVPPDIGRETVFTQLCGYPLQTIYRGQYRYLATPSYAAPGCEPGAHCAFVIVRMDDPSRHIEDLRGQRFAVNSPHSNSGMNLPRRLFAPLAQQGRFFGKVVLSGSHSESLRLIQIGLVDAASVDCLTWAFALEHAPELVEGLRPLARTAMSPALPFVTGLGTSEEVADTLRHALLRLGNEPLFADIRKGLRIEAIEEIPERKYEAIIDHEHESRALGYAEIA